jgi:uncharacterized repeat protein (TIGR03803 family)
MRHTSYLRGHARSLLPALLILACSFEAGAQGTPDTYDPTNDELSAPVIGDGNVQLNNVVLTIGELISGPTGNFPDGTEDFYAPSNNEVTVQTVTVGTNSAGKAGPNSFPNAGTTTYYNVVAKVKGLVSIGSVSGADTYTPPNLSISFVQLGPTVYDKVIVTPDAIVSVGGGMPALGPDTYTSLTNELFIPAVQYGSEVFTNVTITVGTLVSIGGIAATDTESVRHSFSGNGGVGDSTDGAQLEAGLLAGTGANSGYFYGTSYKGGTYNSGAVFRIAKSGTLTPLYSFTGNGGIAESIDGAFPGAGLIADSAGNLYGTTEQGGANGTGTVFKITSAGTESVLYSFGQLGGADGTSPYAGLVLGSDGNFYGTTKNGGAYGEGVVFKLTASGTETVLYSFSGDGGMSGSNDGANPEASLVQASDGNFYGTTLYGGTYDQGSVFKITPSGAEAVLYSFSGNGGIRGSTDGALSYASLIQASDGNLYGTTEFGGAHGEGTVFRITLAGAEAVLYSFTGGPEGIHGSTDGAQPVSNLTQGNDGNYYGATFRGGTYDSGTVFKLSESGVESVLHSFSGSVNGTGGLANSTDGGGGVGLLQGNDGNLYGTTEYGGQYDEGTVFIVTLPFY